MAKTPKPAAAKPATTPAVSATKAPQSAKKPENQLALEAKLKQTPNKALAKKLKDEEDVDESDSDDREEMATFTKGKKNADPEDEELDEDDEDAEQDEEEDDVDAVYFVMDHLRHGNQIGITVPAQCSLTVVGAAMEHLSFPLHITNACLGPDAADNDRATLIVSTLPPAHEHDHDHDHEEEEEEHKHDHEDEEREEIVAGTLCKNFAENLQLDLVLDGDFVLTNLSNETDIYLTARVIIGEDEDEDYDEEDYEDEEEEDEEDEEEDEDEEDEDAEDSRMELGDEDEEEEDLEVTKARAMEARKRLLGAAAGNESKKAKPAAAAPKVLDIKPAESKKAPAAAAPAAGKPKGGDKPSADAVKDFILGELKTKKSIKNTDLGTMVVNKFGMPFKAMGFEEKSLTKFLESVAKGKIGVTADSIKLVE